MSNKEYKKIQDSVLLNDPPSEMDSDQAKYYQWITDAMGAFNKVWPSMQKDREYFEHSQDPSFVPADKEYIKENKITDLVRRLVGGMIGGKISPVVKGGDKLKEPFIKLFDKILEVNRFREYVVEKNTDEFYCEGYSGIKYEYNPMKESIFGIGSPEIIPLRNDQLWLDPGSRDGRHEDDRFRIFYDRKPVSYAYDKWPKMKDQIQATSDEYLAEGNSEEEYCDVYEIEFCQYEFVRATYSGGKIKELEEGQSSERTFMKEVKCFYKATVVNKTVIVEEKKKQKQRGWTLIPLMHTPRKDINNDYGRYPFGPVRMLVQNQDLLNVINSIMGEIVKKGIKTLAIISGDNVQPEVEEQYRAEASKEHGVVTISGENVRVDWAPQMQLPPALLQFKQQVSYMFDTQIGKFSPDRGEISGSNSLSGVAIGRLQSRGALPEYVAQAHIEDAYTQLGKCIYHSVTHNMNTPFKIVSDSEGNDIDIYFNTPADRVPDNAKNNGFNIEIGGYVNPMNDIDLDVSIEVYMNLQEKENIELEKAAFALNSGALALKDFVKILYPRTWQEKWDNIQSQNNAMALTEKISQMAPEAVGQLNQMADGLTKSIEQAQNIKLPGGPVSL